MKEVAVGILVHDGRILVCQRKRSVQYPLKWEFPGGKVEHGELPEQTVDRELYEELQVRVHRLQFYHLQEWVYNDVATQERTSSYRVHYYLVQAFSGEPLNKVFEDIRWVTPRELSGMDVLQGNRDVVDRLLHDGQALRVAGKGQ